MDEGGELVKAYQAAVELGDTEAMEAAAMQFMAFACEQSEKDPSADLKLKLEAHEHEMAGDWQKAAEAYRQALALAEAENNAALISNAHHDLSSLYALLGQMQRALEEAKEASEAARRAEITPLLTRSLENQAHCWLRLGETASALAAANEIFSALEDGKMSDTPRARALVLRARCYAAMQETTPARDDLNRAWPLLAAMAGAAMFAGVHSGLAGWWEVTASLRNLDSDLRGAVDAWREAVERRRHVSQLPQLEGPYKFAWLANTLDRLGKALLAVEDLAGADETFRESREIRQRIGQIQPGSAGIRAGESG